MTRQRSICTSCGTSFWRNPDETWKHLCLECWRDSKAKTDRQADNLQIRLDKALIENAMLHRKLARLEAGSGIPPEMLARLIRLAHPDRHQGSEAANIATAWLLAQRKGAGR